MSNEIRNIPIDNPATLGSIEVPSGVNALPAERCLQILQVMIRARVMEEQMIKMSKSGQGHFWIGGPGEEAFNTCLGLQVKKGCGPAYDYLHLHYRNSATMVAMGMPLLDGIRQMAMRMSDRYSYGRNFAGHYSKREWNVLPVSSVIEVQFAMAPGTALMQKRHEGGNGVTIVVGGDAGTAEGDFASCMIWSARPGNELPVLMIVMNNGWGISTPASSQHAEERIIDRGKAFGIPGTVVDGNDPIASWFEIRRGLEYCRQKRRPFMIEAMVSRLHGHSSSSGAIRDREQADCIETFEDKLMDARVLNRRLRDSLHETAEREAATALARAMSEAEPTEDDIMKGTYAPSSVDAVYPDDYTGLPT